MAVQLYRTAAATCGLVETGLYSKVDVYKFNWGWTAMFNAMLVLYVDDLKMK